MRRSLTILSLVLATVACDQLANSTQQIAAVAVKMELVAIGKAEARYQVENSTYATIEQLQKADLLIGDPDRKGYAFTLEINGSSSFSATATPADEKNKAWPTYAIDQTQQVTVR
jgi:hypothetical protein